MPRTRSTPNPDDGSGRYYEGRPCAAGHTIRHTVNRSCVTCQADAQYQRRRNAQ